MSSNNVPKELWNMNPLPQEEMKDNSDTDTYTWTAPIRLVDSLENNIEAYTYWSGIDKKTILFALSDWPRMKKDIL